MSQISVADYYAGKSILITGATGFMGKVLVEKLLRCCPELKTMYLMVRKKKGKNAESRLDALKESRAFEKLLEQNPKAFNKVKLICGDTLEEGLGMSISDVEELERECQIVFNNAACVKFDLPLREAVKVNTVGLLRILKLAERMKKLEVFVHISTAFCHDDLEVLEEQMYPSKHNPLDVIDSIKWMDDEMLDACQATIIKPHPNTYSYSKSLAEQLLSNYAGKFPIALGRPSVVLPAEKEPFPGWVDNINGPSGVVYASSRGVLHSIYCKISIKIDTIPVDHTINGLILLAYTTGLEKPKDIRVCNLTLSGLKSISWVETANLWAKYVKQYPLSYCLWYPIAKGKNYKIEHQIDAFFTHVLPAYFIDLILFLLGQKTFMVNVLNRLTYGLEVLEYYTTRSWNFKNDYFRSLESKIAKEEREVFYTDLSVIDNEEFMKNYVKGIREFYCKEDLSTIPKAKKLQRRMYYLHLFTVYSLYAMCLYIIYRICIKIF